MKKTLEKFVINSTQKLSVEEQKQLKGKLGPPYAGIKIPHLELYQQKIPLLA